MMTVERSALLAHPPARVLALVQDVPRYPEFLPGCVAAGIESQDGAVSRATLRFTLAGLTESFTTENTRSTTPEGEVLDIRLLRGPFRRLTARWHFHPLGETGCKVTLTASVEGGLATALLSRQLDGLVERTMQHFRQRADQLALAEHAGG
jgi:ribosome-associated toxin RatA of RatAB toxin-antitoxin module